METKHGRDGSFFACLSLLAQNTYIQCYAEGLTSNVTGFEEMDFMGWLELDEVIRGHTLNYWN